MVTRRHAALLLTALSGAAGLTLAACALIAGIGDDHLQIADAGPTPSSQPDTSSPPACRHASPPGPPDADVPGDDRDRVHVLAIRKYELRELDDNRSPNGYDLDLSCTCDPLEQHQASCRPASDASPICDRDAGIDNAAIDLFKAAGQNVIDLSATVVGTMNQNVECGRATVLILLRHYNGQADDPSVEVDAVASYGIHRPDAGDLPDADSPADPPCWFGGNPRFRANLRPGWDGGDPWSVGTNSVSRSGGVIGLANGATGWVKDRTLVIDLRRGGPLGGSSWTLFLGGQSVALGTPVLEAKLVPLDAQYKDLTDPGPGTRPEHFRISSAKLAGRLKTNDVLSAIGRTKLTGGPFEGSFGCDNLLYDKAKQAVCGSSDLPAEGLEDGHDHVCDGVSISLEFEAFPAAVGEDYAFDAGTSDGGCNELWTDSCDRDR